MQIFQKIKDRLKNKNFQKILENGNTCEVFGQNELVELEDNISALKEITNHLNDEDISLYNLKINNQDVVKTYRDVRKFLEILDNYNKQISVPVNNNLFNVINQKLDALKIESFVGFVKYNYPHSEYGRDGDFNGYSYALFSRGSMEMYFFKTVKTVQSYKTYWRYKGWNRWNEQLDINYENSFVSTEIGDNKKVFNINNFQNGELKSENLVITEVYI